MSNYKCIICGEEIKGDNFCKFCCPHCDIIEYSDDELLDETFWNIQRKRLKEKDKFERLD